VDALPATPAPIEALMRNAELQLAALLVALVVIPGAIDHYGDRTVRRAEGEARIPARKGGLRGGHVRPPRSC
jgi:hypothetical protein